MAQFSIAKARIITGANLKVYVNGRLVGRCSAISWTSMTQHRAIQTIDQTAPAELAITRTGVSFQMSLLRTVADGGAQGTGIVAPQGKVFKEKYATILVVERLSNLPVFQADYCQVDEEAWSVAAKGIMGGSVRGQGISWVNEAD